MSDVPIAPYLPTDDPNVFESTTLANAGWYDEGQHGGAVAALVAGYLETVPTLTTMEVSRFTLELFRVVPLVPLRLTPEILREGKRIQLVETRITDPDGVELARAKVQRLRVDDIGLPPEVEPSPTTFPSPTDLDPPWTDAWGVGPAEKVMFHRNAVEVREISGGFSTSGPGAIWMRLKTPIVAGSVITPMQRLVTVADFCNGVSRLTTHQDWVFMNPDLTVHVGRYPEGEWVALDATSYYSPLGRGVASGSLWDRNGQVGRSAQTLYLDRRR